MSRSNGGHPASYSKFSKKDIQQLGLKRRLRTLFPALKPVAPSEWLLTTLANAPAGMSSEKAKSEFIIAPILLEVRQRNKDKVAVFSGYTFDVDAERGLTGVCDFLFSREVASPDIEAPVFCVFEAKNENIESGIPQCIAAMYAAQIFNRQARRETPVFGAVTYGKEWLFMQLEGDIIWQNNISYFLTDLPQLLGALDKIVE